MTFQTSLLFCALLLLTACDPLDNGSAASVIDKVSDAACDTATMSLDSAEKAADAAAQLAVQQGLADPAKANSVTEALKKGREHIPDREKCRTFATDVAKIGNETIEAVQRLTH